MLAEPAINDTIIKKVDGGRRPQSIREIPDICRAFGAMLDSGDAS